MRGPRVLDARDLLADGRARRVRVVEVAAQRLDARHLAVQRAHLLGHRLDLRGQSLAPGA
jgi:hypothetical protein